MPSSSLVLSVGALTLSTLLAPVSATLYGIKDSYVGANFFDGFSFVAEADPTHGYVKYLDQSDAQKAGLVKIVDGAAYMGVDYKNTYSSTDVGRPSVRIMSNNIYNHGLFIADIAHMPGNACGSWPAFWSLGNGTWPANGEIDIIEGVNKNVNNEMVLHTADGCSVANTGMSGTLNYNDCDVSASTSGCSVTPSQPNNFGTDFNNANGGVYAMEWTSTAIKIWFFPHGTVPAIVTSSAPDTSLFGTPSAAFAGSCDIDKHFANHQFIFDTTFCGDWAGNVYGTSGCPQLSGASPIDSCVAYVGQNPLAFTESYWLVNSFKAYTALPPVSSTKSSTTSSKTSTKISTSTKLSTTTTKASLTSTKASSTSTKASSTPTSTKASSTSTSAKASSSSTKISSSSSTVLSTPSSTKISTTSSPSPSSSTPSSSPSPSPSSSQASSSSLSSSSPAVSTPGSSTVSSSSSLAGSPSSTPSSSNSSSSLAGYPSGTPSVSSSSVSSSSSLAGSPSSTPVSSSSSSSPTGTPVSTTASESSVSSSASSTISSSTSSTASPATTVVSSSVSSSTSGVSSSSIPSSAIYPGSSSTESSVVYPVSTATESTTSSCTETPYETPSSASYVFYSSVATSSVPGSTVVYATTSAPHAYPTPSSSAKETITTVITTSYVDICPTGYVTSVITQTVTYCPGNITPGAPAPGFTTKVTVYQHSTVTLTVPVTAVPSMTAAPAYSAPVYSAGESYSIHFTLESSPVVAYVESSASAPAHYASAPAPYASAPAPYASAPAPYASAPASYASAPVAHSSALAPASSAISTKIVYQTVAMVPVPVSSATAAAYSASLSAPAVSVVTPHPYGGNGKSTAVYPTGTAAPKVSHTTSPAVPYYTGAATRSQAGVVGLVGAMVVGLLVV